MVWRDHTAPAKQISTITPPLNLYALSHLDELPRFDYEDLFYIRKAYEDKQDGYMVLDKTVTQLETRLNETYRIIDVSESVSGR